MESVLYRRLIQVSIFFFLIFLLPITHADEQEASSDLMASIYSNFITNMNEAITESEGGRGPLISPHLEDDLFSEGTPLYNIFKKSLLPLLEIEAVESCKELPSCNVENIKKSFEDFQGPTRIKKFFRTKVRPAYERIAKTRAFKGLRFVGLEMTGVNTAIELGKAAKDATWGIFMESLIKTPYGLARYGKMFVILTAFFEAIDHLVLDPIGMQIPLCKLFQAIVFKISDDAMFIQNTMASKGPGGTRNLSIRKKATLLLKRFQYRRALKRHMAIAMPLLEKYAHSGEVVKKAEVLEELRKALKKDVFWKRTNRRIEFSSFANKGSTTAVFALTHPDLFTRYLKRKVKKATTNFLATYAFKNEEQKKRFIDFSLKELRGEFKDVPNDIIQNKDNILKISSQKNKRFRRAFALSYIKFIIEEMKNTDRFLVGSIRNIIGLLGHRDTVHSYLFVRSLLERILSDKNFLNKASSRSFIQELRLSTGLIARGKIEKNQVLHAFDQLGPIEREVATKRIIKAFRKHVMSYEGFQESVLDFQILSYLKMLDVKNRFYHKAHELVIGVDFVEGKKRSFLINVLQLPLAAERFSSSAEIDMMFSEKDELKKYELARRHLMTLESVLQMKFDEYIALYNEDVLDFKYVTFDRGKMIARVGKFLDLYKAHLWVGLFSDGGQDEYRKVLTRSLDSILETFDELSHETVLPIIEEKMRTSTADLINSGLQRNTLKKQASDFTKTKANCLRNSLERLLGL